MDQVRELGEVLDETDRGGRSHFVADRHKLHAAALFSAMTHVHDRLRCMPKLALQSPTKRGGKMRNSINAGRLSAERGRAETPTPPTPELER